MEEKKIIVTTNNLNNSNKARREADKQELAANPGPKDIKANVKAKVKKESFGSKLKRAFFGDNVENVGDYMFFDVGVPAFKATISDMIGNGIEVLLFGEARGRRRDRGTDYARVSRDRDSRRDRYDSDRDRSDNRSTTYRDIYFENKSDAQKFIADVYDYVKDYGRISVSVYMSIGGLTSTSWDDNHKGWYKEDLANLGLIRTRYGWEIDAPRPQRMD